jgi:hypothetical protein
MTATTAALPADVASADIFDVMLDATGNLWVRAADRTWAYVTEDGLTDSDIRATLPDEYAPYSPLDAVSTAIVLRGVAAALRTR